MTANNLTLFVGDVSEELSFAAKKFDPDAQIILHLEDVGKARVGYVSLGDMSLFDFVKVLDVATKIHFVDVETWSHPTTRHRTLFWLYYYSHKKKVYDLPSRIAHSALTLEDCRKTDSQQLWVAGCSYTVGHGLSDKSARWGDQLSQKLNLPVSTLARYATSIDWAADQILRSDIRRNDIVVWGITGASRVPYFDGQVNHITSTTYPHHREFKNLVSVNFLTTEHMIYSGLTHIEQVIKHSMHIGYKLFLTKFPLDIPDHEYTIMEYLSQFDFFIPTYITGSETFLDQAPTGHPGPNQHLLYADLLYKHIKTVLI